MPLRLLLAALAFAALAPVPAAAEGAPAAPPSAALARLRGLAGEWSGTAQAGKDGKPLQARATVKVVSAGSAIMLVTDPGGEHEMVTLFHEDDGALLATHYCAAMNQPRMRAKPSVAGADRIVFEFMDGTNLKTNPGHMQQLALSFPTPDRHVEEWTFAAPDGKRETMRFELTRAAAPAAAR
jgi:hypothetical protein